MIEDKIKEAITKYQKGLISPVHFRDSINDILPYKTKSDDKLPPTPEGAVVLPVEFEIPLRERFFEGWIWSNYFPLWDKGIFRGIAGNPTARYAVPADSEIARINGVGVPKEYKPRGWAVAITLFKKHGLSGDNIEEIYLSHEHTESEEKAIGNAVKTARKQNFGYSIRYVKTVKIE